jgi:hypothetical protein
LEPRELFVTTISGGLKKKKYTNFKYKKALKKSLKNIKITTEFFRFYLFCAGFACALIRGCLGVMYEQPALGLGMVLWIPYKAIKKYILEF